MRDRQFVFAPFRLAPASQELWRGETLVALRPKLFAVLQHLVEHAGRLVTRAELCAAVWPATVLSESVLRGAIRELREALDDDATAARFIETVPHRGYRFVASVIARHVPPPAGADPPSAAAAERAVPLTGRDAELARLQQALLRAEAGTRQVVFVTGEPGIGKTALVDAFLAAAAASGTVLTARGQCVEHYGASEAYLPILEALGQLGQQGGEELVRQLSRSAPTWAAQMPSLVGDAELEAVQHRVQGATRERMLRELAEALEALTVERTVVLVLEDLHWSDYSTVDMVAMLAQRRLPARLLVLATYRPTDVIVSAHPLKGMKQELLVRGRCEELVLRLLREEEVTQYLAARFPDSQLPSGLGAAIRRRTEGNPLFMVNVVDYWLSEGMLVESAGRWRVTARLEELAAGVPETLRQMVEQQLSHLTDDECGVLEVASVAGVEFSTAMVAAGLGASSEQVDARCERLAQRHQFLRARGTEVLADGTVSGRYGFLHALYPQVLYERIAPVRRVRLHRSLGTWCESAYGARVGDLAAELAMHFERGQDPERALRHLLIAGQKALLRSAHPDAAVLSINGLSLLRTLPETPERMRLEIALQVMLAFALRVAKGFAVPEVGEALQRSFQLCQQVGESSQLTLVMSGLCTFRYLRGELKIAEEWATELSAVAQATGDLVALLWSHTHRGMTLAMLGRSVEALHHLKEGAAIYDPKLHKPDRVQASTQDARVTCFSFAALTLWGLGYPDQARRQIDEAFLWAQELSHPFSMAFNLAFGCAGVELFLRNMPGVALHADMLMQLSREQGFPYWLGWGQVWQGRTLVEQGQPEAGITMMGEGMTSMERTGAQLIIPFVLGQLAEAHGMIGHATEGLELLARARTLVERTGERWYEAEIHRLTGELRLQAASGAPSAQRPAKKKGRPAAATAATGLHDAVEADLRAALDVARRQRAKSFELRAAMSVSRLWQNQGKRPEARALLTETYGWFTEGFDTPDLRDARTLLAALA